MTNIEILPPNTRRIVEGFRDTGYSFPAAIADIVDNSIEAGARNIGVQIELMADRSVHVAISDDGSGMSVDELRNAMKYGADEKEDPHRLGRFGLGLKTASTSFCKRLVVVTRSERDEKGDVLAAAWDLDLIEKENDWCFEIGEANPNQKDAFDDQLEMLGSGSRHGTVVIWEKVDRLLKKRSGGEYKDINAALARRIDDVTWHLRTVFQRFLDHDDDRAPNVTIRLNGVLVPHWDPFCTSFPEVAPETERRMTVSNPELELSGEIVLRAFILPKPNETSQPTLFKAAARTAGSERQGFFVYREDRMIEEPGWLNRYASETHLRSLRIELSFPATLDPIFGVGLRKTGLHLDEGFFEVLDEIVTPLRREADNRDRKGSAKKLADDAKGIRPSDRSIASQRQGLTTATVSELPCGEITLRNNQTDSDSSLLLRGSSAAEKPDLRVEIVEGEEGTYVDFVETVEDGVLWAPAFRSGPQGDTQVLINVSHDWFKRAYMPLQENSVFCQSVEFLLFALAQAELNNTNSELDEDFRQFRIEVSRNLRKLVSDLPEYEPTD